MQPQGNTDAILNGSYIVFSCVSGYTNNGGTLNVTCNSNGSWSQFPNCVSSSGTPCTIDPLSTFNITNGYSTGVALTYVSNTTATGNRTIPTVI